MSQRPHNETSERMATLIQSRHSNQLSMQEVRDLAYDLCDLSVDQVITASRAIWTEHLQFHAWEKRIREALGGKS